MMRLTDAAANHIKSVMANAGRPIVGVRVGVKNGGCAGMAYTMEYAESPASSSGAHRGHHVIRIGSAASIRMVFEFTMLNQGKAILCAINTRRWTILTVGVT